MSKIKLKNPFAKRQLSVLKTSNPAFYDYISLVTLNYRKAILLDLQGENIKGEVNTTMRLISALDPSQTSIRFGLPESSCKQIRTDLLADLALTFPWFFSTSSRLSNYFDPSKRKNDVAADAIADLMKIYLAKDPLLKTNPNAVSDLESILKRLQIDVAKKRTENISDVFTSHSLFREKYIDLFFSGYFPIDSWTKWDNLDTFTNQGKWLAAQVDQHLKLVNQHYATLLSSVNKLQSWDVIMPLIETDKSIVSKTANNKSI